MQFFLKSQNVSQVHRIKRKSIVGQVVLVWLGLEVLFFAAFAAFDLPTPTAHNISCFATSRVQSGLSRLPETVQQRVIKALPKLGQPVPDSRSNLYVPLAPAAIFIGYTLGWPLGTVAALSYFLLGLAGPLIHIHPFAAGGGSNYYLQPGFGYLLGMILSTSVVGLITAERRSSLSQALGLIGGLVTIHAVGLAYMLGTCLFFALFDDPHNSPVWSQWVFEQARNLTWYSLPYDFIFGLMGIGIGFPIRWLANTLIAPDIAFKKGVEEQPQAL